jgi:hypothetical protein
MGLLNQTQQEYYEGNSFGNYQFVSLRDIIEQFMVVYVGDDKIIPKARRIDVAFHAQRALAELSFDTLKSCKAQELVVPASLQLALPQDYVNYTKVSWVDSSGIKHLLYPASKTSNPSSNPIQNSDGEFKLQAIGDIVQLTNSITLSAQYDNIKINMFISGPYIPDGTIVSDVDNTGGVTTILMQDGSGSDVLPVVVINNIPSYNVGTATDATLTFTNVFPSNLSSPQKHITVENLTYVHFGAGSKTITGTASEMEGLEVGMLVNSHDFSPDTTITHVSSGHVTISSKALVANAGGGIVTFISPDNNDTDTWANYKSGTPSENQDDYKDDTYWPMDGSRFGLDPQHAQANGSFYEDCNSGKMHFSSNIAGKTVILDYISDSLGTDDEMQVHKFAEEAMYKCIAHAVMSSKANVPEYQVNRFKKERFAAIRTAKLRLSNLKLEELTQILRGKSKQIKH